ncbi:DUF2207 family protein [Solihabitans fulvus]|uniref:DUF2207 family protein n=1 Tax=Solihabitans fulvus TaxID=1892852 RepID=UPI001CB75D37|nr:DUF2207 domain-containing protein [Solihabitans fulvus]
MLKNWGARTAATIVLAGVALGFGGGSAGAAVGDGPQAPPLPVPSGSVPTITGTSGLPDSLNSEIRLKVERDGKLTVTELISVPQGKTVHRAMPLRLPVGTSVDRVFTVSNASVQGSGTASATSDEFDVSLNSGASTITYTVDGTVADMGDRQEVRWQVAGGWDTRFDTVTVSLIAPSQPKSVTCLSGPPGSVHGCSFASVSEAQAARASVITLRVGERIDFSVGLPLGSVPVNAKLADVSDLASAFALTPATGAALGLVVLLLIVGLVLLGRARARDGRALTAEVGPVNVLVRTADDHVAFASPDGVLPGQVGTLVDEHVDVVDVTATVIDLAVRNYLWIEEIGGAGGVLDWRIVRRNPVDQALAGYERAVYQALLPGETQAVLLSELRTTQVDLAQAREELYTDVVAKGWFGRRPDARRTPLWWAGAVLAGLGVAATVALALTIGGALFGLAAAVLGVALLLGARWMPARTKRGSALLAQVKGVRDYLYRAMPTDLPEADRELVFSRSLPYAVVLGATDRWLATFAEVDADADGAPGLYWFGEAQHSADLRRFAVHFPALLSALDGVLAQAGHLRSLRA